MLYMRELLQFCLLWTIDWGGHRVLDGIHDRSRQQLYTMKSTSHHHQKPALEFFWSICSSFFVRGKTFFSLFYEDSLDSFADIILGELFHGKMDDWYMCVLGHKSQHSIKCEIFTRFPCYICIFCINAQKYMTEFGWLISWNEYDN